FLTHPNWLLNEDDGCQLPEAAVKGVYFPPVRTRINPQRRHGPAMKTDQLRRETKAGHYGYLIFSNETSRRDLQKYVRNDGPLFIGRHCPAQQYESGKRLCDIRQRISQ